MADFLSAINEGLSNAVFAKKQNTEIYTIIEDLSRQVQVASAGLVGVALIEQNLPLTEGEVTIARLLNGVKYKALVLKHRKLENDFTVLARWQHDQDGYPVHIYIEKFKYACADKQSIEATLLKIINRPAFGSSLHNLMIKRKSGEELKEPEEIKLKDTSKKPVIKK